MDFGSLMMAQTFDGICVFMNETAQAIVKQTRLTIPMTRRTYSFLQLQTAACEQFTRC